MASAPSPVNPGDPATSSNWNKMVGWVGNPQQAYAWGAGFSSTPPAGSQLLRQLGWASVTTNASGVATVSLPSAFPSGLAWWWANTTTAAAFTLRTAVTGATASTIVFVVYNAAGTALANTAVSFVWEAIGW